MSNPLFELAKHGQSVWLDNINREIILNGSLTDLINNYNVTGVTSNPAIFQKAMASGTYYDEQILSCIRQNPVITTAELFDELALKDIQDTADALFNIYRKTNHNDGFVSLEVTPDLAYDTEKTIESARRLFRRAARPNVMIKIPATEEGIPAIRQMISEGVNINVTLIFSEAFYEKVVDAYISGLEDRLKAGKEINNIASVASFFISRIDSAVDKELSGIKNSSLAGRIAIANAKSVYQKAKTLFGSERFNKLAAKGASIQRLLWASTGTKNPAYSSTLYIDEFIGKNTVNTMPPATMNAFKEHGKAVSRIEEEVVRAYSDLNTLKELGINFTEITDKLTQEGVTLFLDAYNELLAGLDKKRISMIKSCKDNLKVFLPAELSSKIKQRLDNWEQLNFVSRLWKKDYTLWKNDKKDDVELSNRLGWLKLPAIMKDEVQSLNEFAARISRKFETIFVLGMGGSSLAPEVFYKVFGSKKGYPDLVVIDSTHPAVAEKVLKKYNPEKSLFLAASKSGGTTETMSFFRIFYDKVAALKNNPGENFIAITDPGSSLEKLAQEKKFLKIFSTPEEVGGRYSAFTYFGLLPAALIGLDLNKLLQKAERMMFECNESTKPISNPGILTGAMIGELALAGIDKLTFFTSKSLAGFPVWVEQLIAESTGKEGKGILPVVDELPGIVEDYNRDRAFVYLKMKGDDAKLLDHLTDELISAGYPVMIIELEDIYDLGKEFYRWEIATAAAGAVLEINPFDQPNVQLAKTLAAKAMKSFSETGKLSSTKIHFEQDGISAAGEFKSKDIKSLVSEFFANGDPDSYAAIMAFIPYSEENDKALEKLRVKIRGKYKYSVTAGYGPRFLHSTGQLHKGDGNKGLFIQITSEIENDVPVPGTDYSLGTLITAQAQGDYEALSGNGRRVLKFIMRGNIAEKINRIASLI
jgi:transaldolase/glucose-6-phosphate isomerase